MSYDLDKIISYGQKIGAEVAIVNSNGKVNNYYKSADTESKYCSYTYTKHNNGRPLRWESTGEYSYERIIDYNRKVLGREFDVIQIPKAEGRKQKTDQHNALLLELVQKMKTVCQRKLERMQ